MRQRVARDLHGEWTPAHNRRDPIELVIESSKGRIPELVPIRYGRMMLSPFVFYRGTANIMASDLAPTPVTGLHSQLCGDAHLLNFGGFASPERRLILDINDFDETLRGPWEWDLKRLGWPPVLCSPRVRTLFCCRAARGGVDMRVVLSRAHDRIRRYAGVGNLVRASPASDALATAHDKATRSRLKKRVKEAQKHGVPEHDFPRLTEAHSGRYLIKDAPPLIYHHPQMKLGRQAAAH